MQRIGFERLARRFARDLVQGAGAEKIDHDRRADDDKSRNGRLDRVLLAEEAPDRLVDDDAGEKEQQRGLRQRRDAFELAVPVMMLFVGRFAGNPHGDIGHHGGGEIDQRMRGFRQDRERAGHHADHALGERQSAGGRDRREGDFFLVLLHDLENLLRRLMPVIWRSARPNSTEIADNANHSQRFFAVEKGLHVVWPRNEGDLAPGRILRHFTAMHAPIAHSARRFCVAPMMEWTDRHCRFFHRLLTRKAVLYTEMITTGAVIHGDRERLLGFDAVRASGGVAARRLRSAPACRKRAHRRGLRLSRNQSQCRLPVRSRAGGPFRRLPDGRARSGRQLASRR